VNPRHFGVDLLKVVCAQLIVLHHAVVYAPSALALERHWPRLTEFFFEPGRWVVHVFLVLGGYLSAQGLARVQQQGLLTLAWRRYVRLIPLFMLAVATTLVVSWVVQRHYAPDFLTSVPSAWGWLSHLTLTFDWLGVEAVCAGAWYVAIDFQLYLLLAAWVLLARRRTGVAWIGWRAGLMAASVLLATIWLSRMPELDAWAPYFWASYGLGVLVAWSRQGGASRRWLWCLGFVWAVDLVLDFRGRQALALASAALIYVWPYIRTARSSPRWIAQACDLSYAVFVGHFSLLIALGAWWTGHGTDSASAALIYWLMCAALGWIWGWALQRLLDESRAWFARYFGPWPGWA
jgi:peptidoglycan/LPS O-acetylase OafA/YrhL